MQFVKRASRRGVKGDDHKCSPETQKQVSFIEEIQLKVHKYVLILRNFCFTEN